MKPEDEQAPYRERPVHHSNDEIAFRPANKSRNILPVLHNGDRGGNQTRLEPTEEPGKLTIILIR